MIVAIGMDRRWRSRFAFRAAELLRLSFERSSPSSPASDGSPGASSRQGVIDG